MCPRRKWTLKIKTTNWRKKGERSWMCIRMYHEKSVKSPGPPKRSDEILTIPLVFLSPARYGH